MSSNKIGMALDDIIQKNRTKKRERKIQPIKRANNNNNQGRNQGFQRRRFNNNRNRGGFKGNMGNNRGSVNRGGRRNNNFRGRNNNQGRNNGNSLNRGNRPRGNRNRRNQPRRQNNPTQQNLPNNYKCRIRVSGLSTDITNQELFDIFNEIGQLKRCGIHWDALGKSKGTADLEYYNSQDAEKAIQNFNNAECQGKNLKVEFLLSNNHSTHTTRGGVTRRRIKTSNRRGRNNNFRGGRGRRNN